MKIIESSKIKEKAYVEKLENGMQVIIIPKQHTKKKYVIWGTHFGSIDNHFIMPKTGEEVYIPDGVAHFLEHKMFEQPDGTNSLDTLMALGIDANAYTTNDHTASIKSLILPKITKSQCLFWLLMLMLISIAIINFILQIFHHGNKS